MVYEVDWRWERWMVWGRFGLFAEGNEETGEKVGPESRRGNRLRTDQVKLPVK